MPYPLDDNGNIRVDFVWGNFPLQPDEQRTGQQQDWVNESNQPEDKGWTARSFGATSDTINTVYTQYLSVGDQNNSAHWDEVDTRQVSVPSAHDIATTGYNNFPAFLPNYAGDGDTVLEAVMPNLIGLGSDAFVAALQAAGFSGATGTTGIYANATIANQGTVISQTPAAGATVNTNTQPQLLRHVRPQVPNVVDFDSVSAAEDALDAVGLVLGTVTTSTVGATSGNNNWVKSQSIAPGTTVDGGTVINLVEYDYVVSTPSTTGPIAGFNRISSGTSFSTLNGDDAIMYLVGQTVRPAVGDTITVTESSNSQFNRNWTVAALENNDSYNTGGTAVKITVASGDTFTGTTASGGTWTKL